MAGTTSPNTDREVTMQQVITTAIHHSAITADQSAALMEQRADYVAAGRPADHPYARAIALIEYDRPGIMVRTSRDGYSVVTI